MRSRIRILHIITGLDLGGAETVLYNLLYNLAKEKIIESRVISLLTAGPVAQRIQQLGIEVESIGLARDYKEIFNLKAWLRLIWKIKKNNPQLVQTWMYHADLIGGLAAKVFRGLPVIWGVHNVNLDLNSCKKATIWIAKLCGKLSRWIPQKIVSCSEAATKTHLKIGYALEKFCVIPNGIDINLFCPDEEAYLSVREELKLPRNAILVGFVARFGPPKDHRTFVMAAKEVLCRNPNVHFVLCGNNVVWDNDILTEWINDTGFRDNFHLLGPRRDVNRIMAALDICTLSSWAEAFPNVVGEAMACGVPCVVSDVGDTAMIVGDTGIVVPPKNPTMLAWGIERILVLSKEQRRELSRKARQRIIENFSLEKMAKDYIKIYNAILNRSWAGTCN